VAVTCILCPALWNHAYKQYETVTKNTKKLSITVTAYNTTIYFTDTVILVHWFNNVKVVFMYIQIKFRNQHIQPT